jgi:putative addiction module component (TIGR02574 family)
MSADLLNEARRLPVDERIALVEAIWDTVAEDATLESLPLPESHREELDRRLADRKHNPAAERPWDEVLERLKRR